MIKIVRTHRKPRKLTKIEIPFLSLKFTAKIVVYCELCNLLQNSVKYVLSLFKPWKYFEEIMKQLWNSWLEYDTSKVSVKQEVPLLKE